MLNTKHNDSFELPASAAELETACREAVAEIGWRILDQGQGRIRCKEVASSGMSFTWPAEVEIVISGGPSSTRVDLNGTVFGLGPIQGNHLRGQMGNLRNRIELAAGRSSKPAASSGASSGSLTDELEKLASLRDQGVLNEDEFLKAKQRLLGT
jgi:hypothetical protein